MNWRRLNRTLLKWLFGLVVLLAIFSFLRGVFHIYNRDLLTSDGNKTDLFMVYFWGFRYDLSVLFLYSLPVLVLMSLEEFVLPGPAIKKLTRPLVAIYYSLLVVISVADIPYYRFNSRRATREVFDIMADTASALPSFLVEFAGFVFLALFLIYVVYRASRKLFTGWLPWQLTIPLTLIFFVLAINFGKPLTPKNATFHVDPGNVSLVTNTPLTLGYSILKGQATLPVKSYFSTEEELESIFKIHHQFASDSAFNNRNVVVFVLESFSREYLLEEHINKAPTPFLDSIIKMSTVYSNAFANGTTSAYGLMSILGGIPPFLDEPYFASIYGDNQIKGIGSLLEEKGYNTHFFYGAEEDHYGFRKNMSLLGIDQYHSREDYRRLNGTGDYDGHWGIYDEAFFQFAAQKLRNQNKPFFATIFNISTHFPYMVPDNLKEVLPEGYLPSHQSIAYTDFSLEQFFSAIDTTSWFDQTLFVFIADHWAKMREMEDKSSVGIYRIPFFIYDPEEPGGRAISTVTDQVDVIPILLERLNYSGPWMSFGSAIQEDNAYNFTFNEFEDIYRIIDSSFVLAYDENREASFSLHNYQEDLNLNNDMMWRYPEKAQEMEQYLRAVIQTYNNHLVNNDVYIERDK